MPTQTFQDLPQEKQLRILSAAWDEFISIPFADASVNRILQAAHIPRGSFYQYFSCKKDLFLYLLDDVASVFRRFMEHALQQADGDVFGALLAVFDRIFFKVGPFTQQEWQRIQILRMNADLDWYWELFLQHIVQVIKPSNDLSRPVNHTDFLYSLAFDAFMRICKTALIFPAQIPELHQNLRCTFQVLLGTSFRPAQVLTT